MLSYHYNSFERGTLLGRALTLTLVLKVELFEKAISAQLEGVAKQIDVLEAKTATSIAHFEVHLCVELRVLRIEASLIRTRKINAC